MMNLSVQNQPAKPAALKSEQTGTLVENIARDKPSTPLVIGIGKLNVSVLTAETVENAWLKLENWKPSDNKTPEQNVQDLKEQYLALKNYILESVDEASQMQLLNKLERLTEQHVDTLMNTQYGELTKYLSGNQQESAVIAIKYSLLFFILGEISQENPLWPEAFSLQGNVAERSSGAPSERGQSSSGMLQYGPDRRTNLHVQQERSQMKSAVKAPSINEKIQGSPEGVVISYGAKNNSMKALYPKPFTLPELKQSIAFAAHMARYELPTGSLTAANVEKEEWIGVKSGISWLKGQVFANLPGVSKAMVYTMQSAVENQISTSIRQASAALKSEVGADSVALPRFASLEQDAVFSVYNYAVGNYTKRHDAKGAVMSTIFYMIEILKTKEENARYQGMLRYQSPTENKEGGLFKTAAEYFGENKAWFQQIKNNWNRFVKDMNLRSDFCLDFNKFQEQYSIWAQALSPEGKQEQPPKAAVMTMVGWCSAGVLILAAVIMVLTTL